MSETPLPAPRAEDVEFFQRELSGFVPDRLFDAHCHLLQPPGGLGKWPADLPPVIDLDVYRRWIDLIHPGRDVSALFLPFPGPRDQREAANYWISDQIARDTRHRGLFLVHPEDDPDWVRQEVRRLGLAGLKCYHVYSTDGPPTWEANVESFLPDRLLEAAHAERWVIVLHLVKSRAVADPSNQNWIRRCCEKYPRAKLVLAHSARGFQPAHNLEGLPALADLRNLYFDTSANCEPMAHQVILRLFGPERLMYGSDFWVSHFRGRVVGAADSFLWLYDDLPIWGEKHRAIPPVLLGLEHLRSLKWACWSERLTDGQIEQVFRENALDLLSA